MVNTLCPKNVDHQLMAITLSNLTDFQIFSPLERRVNCKEKIHNMCHHTHHHQSAFVKCNVKNLTDSTVDIVTVWWIVVFSVTLFELTVVNNWWIIMVSFYRSPHCYEILYFCRNELVEMIKTHVLVTLQLANLYRFFIKDYNIFVIYSV